MKKELNGGVIAGVLVLVVLVVAVLAWKFVFAPPPSGIKSFTKAEGVQLAKDHAKAVQDMQATQMDLYRKAHGGQ
jgi:hypothetical protein